MFVFEWNTFHVFNWQIRNLNWQSAEETNSLCILFFQSMEFFNRILHSTFFPFLSLVLLVICSSCALSLPVASNSVDVLTKCPSQNPAELLGQRRHHIQHFTPDLLCQSSTTPSSESSSITENSLEGSSSVSTHSQLALTGDLHALIPGCSQAELEDLSLSDASTADCPFHVTCQYDPLRYPAVMYEAKRTSHMSSCPVNSVCLPVVKEMEVLRRESQMLNGKSCQVWALSAEYITTGYQCQKLFDIDDETSNSLEWRMAQQGHLVFISSPFHIYLIYSLSKAFSFFSLHCAIGSSTFSDFSLYLLTNSVPFWITMVTWTVQVSPNCYLRLLL